MVTGQPGGRQPGRVVVFAILAAVIVVAGVVIIRGLTTTTATTRNAGAQRSTSTTATTVAALSTAPPSTTAPPTSPGGPGSVAGSATVPPAAPAPAAPAPTVQMQAAANGYLTARENADSFYQPSPNAWLAQAKPFMTAQGYASLAQYAAPGTGASTGTGFEYQVAHQYGWRIAVAVACAANLENPASTAGTANLTCTVTDQTGHRGRPARANYSAPPGVAP